MQSLSTHNGQCDFKASCTTFFSLEQWVSFSRTSPEGHSNTSLLVKHILPTSQVSLSLAWYVCPPPHVKTDQAVFSSDGLAIGASVKEPIPLPVAERRFPFHDSQTASAVAEPAVTKYSSAEQGVQDVQDVATELLFGWNPDAHGVQVPSAISEPAVKYSPLGQLVFVHGVQDVAFELSLSWNPDAHVVQVPSAISEPGV